MATFLSWRCSVCGIEKPWEAYYQRTNPSGDRVPKNPCKQCWSQQRKDRRQKDPEFFHKYRRQLLEKDPEYFQRWQQNNADKIKEYCKKWRHNHLEQARASSRNFQKRNPAIFAKHAATRRARKLDAFVESIDRDYVYARDQGSCGICGQNIDGPFHIDHIVPLSKDGQHCYANVQAAHPTCNQRKHDKLPVPGTKLVGDQS